jgi:organic radical activating enzyme
MRIRKGVEVETPKQIMDRLERKTEGRSKKEKRTMAISLESQTASIPMTEEPKAKTVLKKRAPKAESHEEKLAKLQKEYSAAHMAVSQHKKGTKAHKEAVAKRDELSNAITKLKKEED